MSTHSAERSALVALLLNPIHERRKNRRHTARTEG
jgi:hypothetical protein